ncbi:cupin-like domain-containing protein [Teredinibacter haidensis]|uniref:cupin-like domain-containing protein n=1 Tax=Teredinibacter haidensis TaxID=2731755 RepID=UPI000948E380|nr:cupin-like domain-containing protein [Teredinibacter haidensis]
MKVVERKTQTVSGVDIENIPYQKLLEEGRPVIFKGIAQHWPVVQAGLKSASESMDYVSRFYNRKKLLAYIGQPEIKGKFFYNTELTGINFETQWVELGPFFNQLKVSQGNKESPAYFIGSTTVDGCLPGFRKNNELPLNHEMFQKNPHLLSIWIGNRTLTSAHYDFSNNLACCLVGKRRFTLFPPDQIANLYPGPLEPTPGGQVVSMVDFNNPDFDIFPRFTDALAACEVADLEPGDVLFYPAMWWHQVESLSDFNVMMNYWWNTTPQYLDSPQTTLLHGILSLRDRPVAEKTAWKAIFDYYLFNESDDITGHIPEHARGNLAKLDETKARRLRAQILSALNR